MLSFQTLLTELFKDPLPWKWDRDDRYEAEASFTHPASEVDYIVKFRHSNATTPRRGPGFMHRGVMKYRRRYDDTPKDRAIYTLTFEAGGKGFEKAAERRDKYFADFPNAPYSLAPPPVSKYSVIGTGGGLSVFSTLADIVTDFMRKRSPLQIIFTAGRDELSRVKLYRHLIKRAETMSSTYRGKEVVSRRKYHYNHTFALTRRKRPAPWPKRDVPGSYVVVPDTDTETPAQTTRQPISQTPPGQERVTGHEWIPNRTYQRTVPTGPPSAPRPFMPRVPRTGEKS